MGNFNPNLPNIIGMEFVPIQSSVRTLDIGTEWGYGFTVTGAPFNDLSTITPWPFFTESAIAGQTVLYNIYPRGREDDTGDINVVRWPVATVFVTGAVVSGASSTAAVQSTSDNQFITFDNASDRIRAVFAPLNPLTGQRILGVDLVYQAAGTPGFVLEPTIESNTVIYPYGPYMTGPASLAQVSELGRVRIGEVNPWWSTAAGPNTETARMPWRYTDMLRWTVGTGGQLYFGIQVDTLPLSGFARLGYLALDVYYCDESRVAYGGRTYGQDPNGILSFGTLGITTVTIRDTSFTTPVTLAPGDYTATVTLADAGDLYNSGDKIALPQVYEYAPVSTHPTIETAKFKRSVGSSPAVAPEAQSTNFMVASGMSASGGTFLAGEAAVPYFAIAGAPVYRTPSGVSITARQEIHEENNTGNPSFPLVRFYARRFRPDSPGSLIVSGTGAGIATITAEEFAALPELTVGENGPGTGWKEVNLSTPLATIGSSGGFTSVAFVMDSVTAPTSTPMDQYQILMARTNSQSTVDGKAYATSGASNAYLLARYDGLQNAIATWKTPETITDTVVTDTSSTAVVMFSQELPAPTGTAAALTSMPVSGIGQGCDGAPECIPESIYAINLTWSPIAVTGAFDHYEIQRSDDLTDWQSIAYVTGHHTASFTDWEARVGMESDYRIRSVNVSDFAGPWSSTASFTLTSPGVGGVGTGNSTLIFTSNHGPTGNLAYVMQFEGEPIEEFTFPEADEVELQRRYQKNFFTAHHGTERGGEQFSRTILVQGAAIAAPSMGNTFSLRDLAWASLPYVCVRDELGNRWFANVKVPSTRVRANRTLYLADIDISEVTDAPAVVTLP